jgi:hypothetical protein
MSMASGKKHTKLVSAALGRLGLLNHSTHASAA